MSTRGAVPFLAPPRQDRPAAVVAVTARGARLAARIAAGLTAGSAYVPERFFDQPGLPEAANVLPYRERAGAVIARLFPASSALVLVMACGAAVRLLAPLIEDKQTDPAVVVVDDGGAFAISLLSGHLGGANDLARRIAEHIGAIPVITTASEGAGVPAADLIGRQLGWRIEPGSPLKTVAAALVNGETVGVYQESGASDWAGLLPNIVEFPTLDALAAANPAAAIIISHRVLELPAAIAERAAVYRPPALTLGIGCSRAAPATEIAALVDRTLEQHGLSPLSVGCVASIDRKADEPGLMAFLRERNWPLTTYSAAELEAVAGDWTRSEVVQRAVGAAGVAEPAALLSAGTNTLLVHKVKSKHVTVAVALRAAGAPAPVPAWIIHRPAQPEPVEGRAAHLAPGSTC